MDFSCCRRQRGVLLGKRFRRRQDGLAEAAQGPDSFHRLPAPDPGEKLREAEVLERPGQAGAGGQAEPLRYPSQDLVSEQKVISTFYLLAFLDSMIKKMKRCQHLFNP